eukprot:SAG25_NODE_5198_length_690_cov_0.742809_2_plen_169_part_01
MGETKGVVKNDIVAKNINFGSWATTPLRVSDGSVTWADHRYDRGSHLPSGDNIAVAQLTIPTGVIFKATMNIMGQNSTSKIDWNETNVVFTNSPAVGAISYHAYQCTCVAGFANGVCEYNFIAQYKTECTVMESMSNVNNKTLSGNCNLDVDECKSKPCLNGALCTDST